jgi:CheY-like chemotaxis protein/anti-sigma regulatory factor (Ser/Thr protein kinase)
MKPARILVVDDSIAIVNSLCTILKVSGFEVDSAFNGSDALRKIHSSDFDVVLCDIEMPGITGLDLLGKVRRDYDRELDVILMTGYLDHDYFIEAIRLGASDFIRKPVDTKQIVRSIHSLLERKNARNDLSDFYLNTEVVNFHFVFDPCYFSKFAISKSFNYFVRQGFQLNHNLLNELLICVDEMVYNAYIHGTLGLSVGERKLDHSNLQQLIGERLKQPEIASKRLRFSFCLDHIAKTITISVEDDGKGFDFEGWLKRVKTEPKLNLDEHGRGISMLYHLADSLEFSLGGRKVTVCKNISNHTPA